MQELDPPLTCPDFSQDEECWEDDTGCGEDFSDDMLHATQLPPRYQVQRVEVTQ